MKKSLILILSVILCISLVFCGCGKTEKTDISNDITDANLIGDVHNANEIIAEEESIIENAVNAADVNTFVSGKFYLEGTMYTEDTKEGMNVNIAMNGSDEFEMTTTLSGLYLGIYKSLEGTYYIINPANNTYLELTDTVTKFLGVDDVKTFDTNFDAAAQEEVATTYTAVKINGQDGMCTLVTNKDNSSIKLYSIGDKLCQVDSFDEKGNLTSRIVVSAMSASIPSNQLTLNGLTKSSSLVKFFSALQE